MKNIVILLIVLLSGLFTSAQNNDVNAVKQVLDQYKKSIEKLDTTGIVGLFITNSKVYEQASDEGSISHYLEHHLGPELKDFKTFSFSDYKVDVKVSGNYAYSTETYIYTIVLSRNGNTIKNQGVATSILEKTKTGWKIVQTHSSFRKAK